MRAHLFSACVLRFCFASLFFGPLFLPLSWSGKKLSGISCFLHCIYCFGNIIQKIQFEIAKEVGVFVVQFLSLGLHCFTFRFEFLVYDLFDFLHTICFVDVIHGIWNEKSSNVDFVQQVARAIACGVCVCLFFQPDLEQLMTNLRE